MIQVEGMDKGRGRLKILTLIDVVKNEMLIKEVIVYELEKITCGHPTQFLFFVILNSWRVKLGPFIFIFNK